MTAIRQPAAVGAHTAWIVWTGELGGYHHWDALAGLSPLAQDLYVALLEASEPMPQVVPMPRRASSYWGRRVQVSMAALARRLGLPTPGVLYVARRELMAFGLVAVLASPVGQANVYALTVGAQTRQERW